LKFSALFKAAPPT